MEYRRLGKSGLQVSAVSLGSWLTFGNQISDDVAEQLMIKAYEAGINFFDNAEVYAHGKSEEVMGKLLKKLNWDRDTWVVSSKVFWGRKPNPGPNQRGLMRKHIVEGCHDALRRLQVEYLDIYFAHRPDINTPMEDIVWTFHNLVVQGKILYWGTSEWTAQQYTEAHLVAAKNNLIGPVAEQNQYNLLHRNFMEKEYIPLFENYGMGTTIWSPLSSGLLTDKYFDGSAKDEQSRLSTLEWLKERLLGDTDKLGKVRQLHLLAKDLGIPLAQMSLAWCLKNKNVSTVILGASKVAQLEENLRCFEAVPLLTDEVITKIDDILQNKPQLVVY